MFFDSYESAMKNSELPVTKEFAEKMGGLADGHQPSTTSTSSSIEPSTSDRGHPACGCAPGRCSQRVREQAIGAPPRAAFPAFRGSPRTSVTERFSSNTRSCDVLAIGTYRRRSSGEHLGEEIEHRSPSAVVSSWW